MMSVGRMGFPYLMGISFFNCCLSEGFLGTTLLNINSGSIGLSLENYISKTCLFCTIVSHLENFLVNHSIILCSQKEK